jgi:hypothetical protein
MLGVRATPRHFSRLLSKKGIDTKTSRALPRTTGEANGRQGVRVETILF